MSSKSELARHKRPTWESCPTKLRTRQVGEVLSYQASRLCVGELVCGVFVSNYVQAKDLYASV